MISRLMAGSAILLVFTAGGSATLAQQAPAPQPGASTSANTSSNLDRTSHASSTPARYESHRGPISSAAGTVASSGGLIAGTVGGNLSKAGSLIGSTVGGVLLPKRSAPPSSP